MASKAKPIAKKAVEATARKATTGPKSARSAPASVTKLPPQRVNVRALAAKVVAVKPAKTAAKSVAAAKVPAPAVKVAAARPAVPPVSLVATAKRAAAAPKAQDLAAAHDYLLSRSATRSGAPSYVNGQRLPTEDDLLQMSEAQYMSADQLAFFKHRLREMERELTSNAEETTEHLRETVLVPDPADRATIEEEHALELRTRDRERKLLKKVQGALQRIESGDYGFCEETGEPIGVPRLLARPTATLSLEAQQRRELKQKLFGD
jgi:DnaK suppressor protein